METVVRIQRSEITIDSGQHPTTVLVSPDKESERIELRFDGSDAHALSPEEAYHLGRALVEHGKEWGFDPDTGHGEWPAG